MGKAIDQFAALMKDANRISEMSWLVTTVKRNKVTPPDGIMLFDTDLNKWFVGDGSTNGGVSAGSVLKIRKVPVDGVLATISDSGSDYDVFYWPTASGLRTGDWIYIAAGGGTLPSGATGTLSGNFYITKQNDVNDGAGNTGTTFKIATSRANAIASSNVDVLMSGVTYQAAVSGVVAQGDEDVIIVDPVTVPTTVGLPTAASNVGFSVKVKRGSGEASAVVITEISGNSAFLGSGAVTMNDRTGSWTLAGSTTSYAEFFSDGTMYQVGATTIE